MYFVTSRLDNFAYFCTLKILIFSRIKEHAFTPSSINKTHEAPRDKASNPRAPVPAKASNTNASLTKSPYPPFIKWWEW